MKTNPTTTESMTVDTHTGQIMNWLSDDMYMFHQIMQYMEQGMSTKGIASHVEAQFNGLREKDEGFCEGVDPDKVDWFLVALNVPTIFRTTGLKLLNEHAS